MKKIILILSFILIIGNYSHAIDYGLPGDLPTIEALINLHKQMKKNEQASLAQCASITAEQERTTNVSGKISEIRSTINKKMCDVNSYIVLATTIINTTTNLKNLKDELNEFVFETSPLIIQKPYTAKYFYNAEQRIQHSIERLAKLIGGFSVESLNVLKASMDEKFKLLYIIDSTINEMRYTLRIASNYIKYSNGDPSLKATLIELVPAIAKSKTMEKLIIKWKQKQNIQN